MIYQDINIPKILFQDEQYKDMSNYGRLIYGLLFTMLSEL